MDRGIVWEKDEIEALISIWGQETIQAKFNSAGHRNQEIYDEIAKKMKDEHNFVRTAQQCRSKVKKLKFDFNACEDNNRKSGNERKECKFYHLLAPVLKDKANVNPKFTKSSFKDVAQKKKR